MSQRVYRVVAAIVRQHDRVLLVQQQGPADTAPTWALPGGLVEDGEVLTEALVREVREETGIDVRTLGPLAYTVQVDNRLEDHQLVAFVFEVQQWVGALAPADPDNVILDVAFVPLVDAIALLDAHPWRVMREPIVAYLGAARGSGSTWFYRHHVNDVLQRVDIVPGMSDARGQS